MNILSVSREDHYRGVPVLGFEQVANAIRLHASGGAGSRGAFNENMKQIGEAHGSLGAALFGIHLGGNTGEFAERVIEDAKKSLATNGSYRGSWDYDGPGPFHKAGVEVEKIGKAKKDEEQAYRILIWAAYVGDEPEKALAGYLNTERCLNSSTITLEVEPLNETQFGFDFQPIIYALERNFNSAEHRFRKSAYVISHLLNDDNESSATLWENPILGLKICLRPENVGRRIIYGPNRSRTFRWGGSQQGEQLLLVGDLGKDWQDETKTLVPKLEIFILPIDKKGEKSACINDTERAKFLSAAAVAEEVLKQLVVTPCQPAPSE